MWKYILKEMEIIEFLVVGFDGKFIMDDYFVDFVMMDRVEYEFLDMLDRYKIYVDYMEFKQELMIINIVKELFFFIIDMKYFCKILVVGGIGIGKFLLCWKILCDWVKNELLCDFYLFYLI